MLRMVKYKHKDTVVYFYNSGTFCVAFEYYKVQSAMSFRSAAFSVKTLSK